MSKWVNAAVALKQLGLNPTKTIGPSKPNQILKKAWEYWGPQIYGDEAPTWDQLVAAEKAALLVERKEQAVDALRQEASRRITESYGSITFEEEVKKRLNVLETIGGSGSWSQSSSEQQELDERVRLQLKYDDIKASIESATTDYGVLSIDVTDDDLWSA